eukprot:223501_1
MSTIESFLFSTTDELQIESAVKVPNGAYMVIYASFAMLIGCIIQYIQHRFNIPIPYTALLLMIGFLLAFVEVNDETFNIGFQVVRELQPGLVLTPIIVFEGAFNTNWHIFRIQFQQIFTLAVIGIAINSFLIGMAVHYIINGISNLDDGYDWSFSFCVMFGAIIANTHAGPIVSEMTALQVNKPLCTLIKSESAIDNGTAFLIFNVFRVLAASGTSIGSGFADFFQLTLGGTVAGVLCGTVCCYLLSNIYDMDILEIILSLCTVYLFALGGEYILGVSSSLILICIGLMYSKNKEAISPNVDAFMSFFWKIGAHVAKTLLFFVTGQELCFQIYTATENGDIHWLTDIIILLLIYVICHITRTAVIWQLYPLLKNWGYGLPIKQSYLLVYSGMPGAVSLALALSVQQQAEFDSVDKHRVLFLICGVVILTLVINATTVKYLVKYLGLHKPPMDTASVFKSATQHLIDDIHHKLIEMK